jgi:hypothetical protein
MRIEFRCFFFFSFFVIYLDFFGSASSVTVAINSVNIPIYSIFDIINWDNCGARRETTSCNVYQRCTMVHVNLEARASTSPTRDERPTVIWNWMRHLYWTTHTHIWCVIDNVYMCCDMACIPDYDSFRCLPTNHWSYTSPPHPSLIQVHTDRQTRHARQFNIVFIDKTNRAFRWSECSWWEWMARRDQTRSCWLSLARAISNRNSCVVWPRWWHRRDPTQQIKTIFQNQGFQRWSLPLPSTILLYHLEMQIQLYKYQHPQPRIEQQKKNWSANVCSIVCCATKQWDNDVRFDAYMLTFDHDYLLMDW